GVAGGGPLLARQLAQTGFVQQRLMFYHLLAELRAGRRDPVTSAAALKQEDTEAVLRFMQSWVMDLITQHAAAGDRVQIINTDARELLQTAGRGINLRALHAYLSRLYEAMALAGSPVNTRLLLESLLVEWADGLRTLETAPLAARGGRT
ncbi:MAG: hypothetical protein KGJ56_03420, partial [Gammaproteobacteria bacterium]|nr:hypothetical protein [Gammaproteobacteria bacterium]